MKHLFIKLSWLPLLVLLASCWKEPVYPDEPSITLNSISTREIIVDGSKDLEIILAVGFKDGDGNLGLSKGDTLPPYDFANGNKFFYNFFVNAFIEINGEFQPYNPAPPVTYNGRYLLLNPTQNNQTLEGELRYTFFITPSLLPLDFQNGDRMKFTIQIADRALNLSNTVETEPIRVFF